MRFLPLLPPPFIPSYCHRPHQTHPEEGEGRGLYVRMYTVCTPYVMSYQVVIAGFLQKSKQQLLVPSLGRVMTPHHMRRFEIGKD